MLAEALSARRANPNLSDAEIGHLSEAGALIEALDKNI
jgi:hypothetical protein